MSRPTRLVTVLVVMFMVAGCTSDDGAASGFPTGTFVAGTYSVDFNEDGTCRWFATNGEWTLPCKYGVVDDLYTEMWFDWPDYEPEEFFPATYYWTFDGTNLTFELWGVDANSSRQEAYARTLVKSK